MQSRYDLENFYLKPDPWGYTTNPEDAKRKERILAVINRFGPFDTAFDIGCGEGFITQDIPAKKIYGTDESMTALVRCPKNVIIIPPDSQSWRVADLVLAAGVLYPQYDYQVISERINTLTRRVAVIAGIKDWLNTNWIDGYCVHEEEFPYREYTQIIKVYRYDPPA